MNRVINSLFLDGGTSGADSAASWACLAAIAALGITLTIVLRKYSQTL